MGYQSVVGSTFTEQTKDNEQTFMTGTGFEPIVPVLRPSP